jgi:hypothetical protein
MSVQSAQRCALPGLFLALALALAGCVGAPPQGTASHGGAASGQSKSAATATAVPAPMLSWRQVSLPASAVPQGGGVAPPSDGFTFSPANGRIIWACVEPAKGEYQILRSRDDAATWQVMGTLTPSTPQATTNCFLRADDRDVNSLVANFAWGVPNSPGPTGVVGYFSNDAGADWTRLPGGLMVQESATFGGATWATLIDTAHNDRQDFVVSQNHLASWQSVTPTGSATSADGVFWVGGSGQLLWSALNAGVLYHSSNGGATWAKVRMPSSGGVETVAAQWNTQAGAWLVCGDHILATNQPHNQNECTSDLGQTWTTRNDLTSTWECNACGQNATPSHGVNPCGPSMMTVDGALLALCGNDPQDTVTTPTSFDWTLSRLAPGATTWVNVGGVPCVTASLTQTGQLWCVGASSTIYTLDQLP